MKNTTTYECEVCHKKIDSFEDAPMCCGKKMTADLDPCTSAPHAEMARNENKDEPCKED